MVSCSPADFAAPTAAETGVTALAVAVAGAAPAVPGEDAAAAVEVVVDDVGADRFRAM